MMNAKNLKNLEEIYSRIKEQKKTFILLAKENVKSNNGNFCVTDLFLNALINRSMSNIEAFILLMKNNNYLAACCILRIEIDSLIRLGAIARSSQGDKLCEQLLTGKSIRNMKDDQGEKMYDGYLVKRLAEDLEINWIEEVYKRTSGFIHLSQTHLLAPFSSFTNDPIRKEGAFSFYIGDKPQSLTITEKIEASECFMAVLGYISIYLKQWNDLKKTNSRTIQM